MIGVLICTLDWPKNQKVGNVSLHKAAPVPYPNIRLHATNWTVWALFKGRAGLHCFAYCIPLPTGQSWPIAPGFGFSQELSPPWPSGLKRWNPTLVPVVRARFQPRCVRPHFAPTHKGVRVSVAGTESSKDVFFNTSTLIRSTVISDEDMFI